MKLAIARSGVVLALAALTQACGGGGSSDNNNGNSGTRMSVSATSVSVTATPGQVTPVRTITLNVTNPPAAGLFVEGLFTASGIESLDFVGNSATQGTLTINFRNPGSMTNDTYADNIQLRVCTEQPCVTDIQGSPVNITTSYVVSGMGTSNATLDRNTLQVTADADDQVIQTETVRLTLSAATATPVHIQVSHTGNALWGANYRTVTATLTDVDIMFAAGQSIGSGVFFDTATLSVCYDASCVRQVQGSPFTISTTMTVSAAAEPGLPTLSVSSRVALPHDVIDAEFSKSLNQLVMVAGYPASTLYVYDVATGIERQVALNRLPMSVSISPDGLTAAVGHDALVTVVDLATVGQPGAPAPTILNVSAIAYDVVLDGNGYVHVLPLVDQWVFVHTVHIASNTELFSTGASLRAGSHGRLHPSGDYLYAANNGLSPSDIEKWDIRTGAAAYVQDSPYHGDYAMCGNLWFNESGTTIYTACGNTFRSSEVLAEDMVYTGQLQLSTTGGASGSPFILRSVSQSEALGEIALLEYDLYRCDIVVLSGPCYYHLAYYESAFLNRLAVYSLGPVAVGNTSYGQRGLFVFHAAAGANKYLISRLQGTQDRNAEYYLSVVP